MKMVVFFFETGKIFVTRLASFELAVTGLILYNVKGNKKMTRSALLAALLAIALTACGQKEEAAPAPAEAPAAEAPAAAPAEAAPAADAAAPAADAAAPAPAAEAPAAEAPAAAPAEEKK